MDALQKLENWWGGHKSRSVKIDIDDGYGATCWRIELRGSYAILYVDEVCFFQNAKIGRIPSDNKDVPKFFYVAQANDDDDWPGLAKTIEFALKKAEEHGL